MPEPHEQVRMYKMTLTMLPYRITPFPDRSAAKNQGLGVESCREKNLRMGFAWCGNVPTPLETIFNISRGPQRPYTAKSKKIKINNFQYLLDFALYGSWEALDSVKILSQGAPTLSTPGKPHSEISFLLLFLIIWEQF